jgi:hypothetical protein
VSAARNLPVHGLAEVARLQGTTGPAPIDGPTVDVDGAARLLHTSRGAVYQLRRRGRMPRPLTARPLVWRVADLIAMKG